MKWRTSRSMIPLIHLVTPLRVQRTQRKQQQDGNRGVGKLSGQHYLPTAGIHRVRQRIDQSPEVQLWTVSDRGNHPTSCGHDQPGGNRKGHLLGHSKFGLISCNLRSDDRPTWPVRHREGKLPALQNISEKWTHPPVLQPWPGCLQGRATCPAVHCQQTCRVWH